MSTQLKTTKIKLTWRSSPLFPSTPKYAIPILGDSDRVMLRTFVESQDNYRKWGSFGDESFDKAVQFRGAVEKYMDIAKKDAGATNYSQSKDGYYDYARWLLTGKIPKLAKPRRSTKWLKEYYKHTF